MKEKKKITVILTVLVLLSLMMLFFVSFYTKSQTEKFVASTTFLMNTMVEQKWYGKSGQRTLEEVEQMLREFENEISLYVENSQIAQINQNAGVQWTEVSPRTYEILQESKEYAEKSLGAFDITIYPLVELWGITTETPHVPEQSEIEATLPLVDLSGLQFREVGEKKEVYLQQKGMAIDLGGIAKGIACELVRDIAEKNNVKGYASIGGNLVVLGKKPDNSDFRFGLRNPRGNANEYVGVLTLEGKTMATTGDYERYFEQDGIRYHHILSPKTGKPVDTDLISLTIVSENGALADFLSTTFFSLGLETAKEYMQEQEFDMIAIDDDYNVYVSRGLHDNFVFSKGDSRFHLVTN